jgi:hypothetical protein
VVKVNEVLRENWAMLEETPFGESWVCVIEGDDLDAELSQLKIGKSAVAFIQEDIYRFQDFAKQASSLEDSDPATLCIGAIENLDDAGWEASVKGFFGR